MKQATLFPKTTPKPLTPGLRDFAGESYEPARDHARLASQFERVFRLMSDGKWRTGEEIKAILGGSTDGIKARLRDFRKPEFGGYETPKRHRGSGYWEYCLILEGRAE